MKLSVAIIFVFLVSANNALTQPEISLTSVITKLNAPMQLVHAGDSTGRIFIVQKAGRILVYSKTYDSIGQFLNVTGISSNGERGLLSMAFHPDYKNNGLLYVYYTTTNVGSLEVARYRVSNNPNIADASSKLVLITIPHPTNSNHNGGKLNFGKDSCLYLSTGDGGGSGDQDNNAQNTSKLLGKILRFKVNTSNTSPYYTIPSDNPFGNEIYAYGLRNPFRWNFDRLTHDMWIGDVGQDSYEEINFRPADSSLGANYGWRCYEGDNTYNTGGCGSRSNYIFPVYNYPTANPSAAITGGTVYRGSTYPNLQGYYLATDFYLGIYYKVKYDSTNHNWVTSTQILNPPIGMADIGEAEDGELYAVSNITNTIYRIDANGPVVYIFTGDGNWDNANNWKNKMIPPVSLSSGSHILIDPVANGESVLDREQTILTGGKITVQPNKQFRITGDLIIQ